MVQDNGRTEIRIRGKQVSVPSVRVHDCTVICTGHWLRLAIVHDEAYVEASMVPDHERFIADLRCWRAKPDLFSFMQHIDDHSAPLGYHTELDNFAVVPVVSYSDWLNNRVRRDVRENVRRSRREGVTVEVVEYNASFVEGIKRLYDDTPVRQGKAFWHHGKPLEMIDEIHATYRDRAEYIGAYFDGELIGFLKMVYTRNIAKTMHVISNEKYHRKRPTNALIAKAVEVCSERGMKYLIYGEYTFPGNVRNSLTEFKKNNGFEEVKYARYYVPLTRKGQVALALGLHREFRSRLPKVVRDALVSLRAQITKC